MAANAPTSKQSSAPAPKRVPAEADDRAAPVRKRKAISEAVARVAKDHAEILRALAK